MIYFDYLLDLLVSSPPQEKCLNERLGQLEVFLEPGGLVENVEVAVHGVDNSLEHFQSLLIGRVL